MQLNIILRECKWMKQKSDEIVCHDAFFDHFAVLENHLKKYI